MSYDVYKNVYGPISLKHVHFGGLIQVAVLCHSNMGHVSFLPSYNATAQIGPLPPLLRFLNHTQLDIRGRTLLYE
jgi:hypothetical protein